MLIILTGPKHAGKSTAGTLLARRLAGTFTDLDGAMEAETGKTPRALYREGIQIFHAAEARALAAIMDRAQGTEKDGVVAAGGGVCDNPAAMALLEKGAVFIVYLAVSPETAWERIKKSAEKDGLPPFLDTENPEAVHRALHERRSKAYRCRAALTVEAGGKSPDDIAAEIFRTVGNRYAARAEKRA
ncbi:MAG: shikimate kinase [Spirochaetaceae bacterium]|jgi:shikimate kinase|nr:shikimate kinase [Spirochaetaceae bacterium]